MPTYNFLDKTTGRRFTKFMSMSEVEEFTKDPNIEWLCSPTPAGDSIRLGRKKPDDGFRDRLREIKKKFKGSTINTF